MKFLKLATVAAVVSLSAWASAQPANEPSAVGLWEQADEKTGQRESWFRIVEKNGIYSGGIVKVFPKPGDDPTEKWLCTKCEGAERNAPVLGGLSLIKGMRRKGLAYENGTITDPRDGSVYRALMELTPDGKELKVRGYLGISLFGRTQTWKRLPDNALEPPKSAPKGGKKK
jgi:uncharacterized protein (DUF2147 family)